MSNLTLLKLGGSLITDKTRTYTARHDKLADLAGQAARARAASAELSLILGHGSGSFGHVPATEHRTREGFRNGTPADYWRGFAEVWHQAAALNRLVMEALHAAGVPAIAFAPASAVTAQDRRVTAWDLAPLRAALEAGLVPVVYGDVVFDQALGGTILSTEDLFAHLARELHPQLILLAGLEQAVWADFPERTLRAERITPASLVDVAGGLGASHGADVTGGMESKVRQMLELVQEVPGLTAQIFSGEEPGSVERALRGEVLGTLITANS